MKINLTIKDAPKWQRIKSIEVNTDVHNRATLQVLTSALRKQYPWGKIIDIRLDMR